MDEKQRDMVKLFGTGIVLATLIVTLTALTSCGSDATSTAATPVVGVPTVDAECSMLRVATRTYLGSPLAEVGRWRTDDEPLLTAVPLNTRGNTLPSTCGWNGSAAFDLVTPGMECSMLGDPAGSSRWLKCDKRGKGRIVGKVLVGAVEYSGSWDIEVL